MSTTVIRVTRPIIIFWYLRLLTGFRVSRANDKTNLTRLQVPCREDPFLGDGLNAAIDIQPHVLSKVLEAMAWQSFNSGHH